MPKLSNAALLQDKQSPLYLLHIPKTAGTSFSRFLESRFKPHEICPAHLWRQLIVLPREDVAHHRLIWGHFYSFLDQHIAGPLRYVVFLRDPIERALSYHGHIRKHAGHYLHRRLLELGSFHEFLLDPETSTTVSNFQLRSLAFDRDPHSIVGDLTPEQLAVGELERRLMTAPFDRPIDDLLEVAKQRLDQMCFIGITERHAESTDLFCRKFGWPVPETVNVLNVNEERLRREDIPADDLRLLQEMNRADYELYKHAIRLFSNDLLGTADASNGVIPA